MAGRSGFPSSSAMRVDFFVPPNLARDLEAKIESPKYEAQSVQRNPQTTQEPVNFNSVQGVCVDDSVGISTMHPEL